MAQKTIEGLAARKVAVDLLKAVLHEKRFFDEAFAMSVASGAGHKLSQRDRAFVYNIVATALRRKGQVEAAYARFLDKPLPKKCGSLREILLCAATQLMFLDTPPHAVLDLAVRQCKGDKAAFRFDKLANAILRRLSEQKQDILQGQDSAKLNMQDWLWRRWEKAYGSEIAHKIAQSHLEEAALDITVKSDPNLWAEKLGGGVLPNGSVRMEAKGRIEQLEGYQDGQWWVQDMAASLCASFLGDVQGKRVADLCAAPGGKTAQLAHSGADVTAVDISAARLKRLQENLKRLQLKAEIVEANILHYEPDQPFDAILLDAPCSATGTIRRNPDIPYLKTENDIKELAVLQAEALAHVVNLLKPGGVLVYCTCSLEPEEGMEQVSRFLEKQKNMTLDPIKRDEVFGQEDWLMDGCLRTLPYMMPIEQPALPGMDGFFAARFRKV